MSRLVIKLVIALLGVALLTSGCASSSADTPETTARKALDAIINANAKAFSELVAPDKQARSGQGTGLAIGPTEIAALANCRDVKTEYLNRASTSNPEAREITIKFGTPCVIPDPVSSPSTKRDTLIVLVEKVNDHWYVAGIQ